VARLLELKKKLALAKGENPAEKNAASGKNKKKNKKK
jgi:hypothetical protein